MGTGGQVAGSDRSVIEPAGGGNSVGMLGGQDAANLGADPDKIAEDAAMSRRGGRQQQTTTGAASSSAEIPAASLRHRGIIHGSSQDRTGQQGSEGSAISSKGGSRQGGGSRPPTVPPPGGSDVEVDRMDPVQEMEERETDTGLEHDRSATSLAQTGVGGEAARGGHKLGGVAALSRSGVHGSSRTTVPRLDMGRAALAHSGEMAREVGDTTNGSAQMEPPVSKHNEPHWEAQQQQQGVVPEHEMQR